jgi:hypothetical protein
MTRAPPDMTQPHGKFETFQRAIKAHYKMAHGHCFGDVITIASMLLHSYRQHALARSHQKGFADRFIINRLVPTGNCYR